LKYGIELNCPAEKIANNLKTILRIKNLLIFAVLKKLHYLLKHARMLHIEASGNLE